MVEACTSLRKNFEAAFSCSDHQPVVLARDVGTDRNDHDPPARATRQQSAAPPTSKVAASRAAPQGRVTDRAPGNPRITAVPMKSAVAAVKRKVVVTTLSSDVYEYVTSAAKGAWYKDFWNNQERYFGGGSDGGGGGSEGGGY